MNAYMLTFGGFLLLGGRLGDLYGHRRLFLLGISLFTLASLACGLANSQPLLIAARAVQGLGGAVVSAVALSLIMNLFTEPAERAKAMGIFGFVCAGGGSDRRAARRRADQRAQLALDLPRQPADRRRGVRAVPCACCRRGRGQAASGRARHRRRGHRDALADARRLRDRERQRGRLDVARRRSACSPPRRCCSRSSSASKRACARRSMPLGLFRLRNVATANVVGVLWAAAMFAWFFISALYMQLVLGYSPLQVGLAFLPANLIMAAFSLGLSAKLVMRFGIRIAARGGAAARRGSGSRCSRARRSTAASWSTCCPA